MDRILVISNDARFCRRLSEAIGEHMTLVMSAASTFEEAADRLTDNVYSVVVVDRILEDFSEQQRDELLTAVQTATLFAVAPLNLPGWADATEIDGVDQLLAALDDGNHLADVSGALVEQPTSGKYSVVDTQSQRFVDQIAEERDCGAGEGEAARRRRSRPSRRRRLMYVGSPSAFRQRLEDRAASRDVDVVAIDHVQAVKVRAGDPAVDLVVLRVEDDLTASRRLIRLLRRRQPQIPFDIVLLADAEAGVGVGLARSLGADTVEEYPVEPDALLEHLDNIASDSERVDAVLVGADRDRIDRIAQALAGDPVELIVYEPDAVQQAFTPRAPEIVVFDGEELSSAKALHRQLEAAYPFAPTRYVAVVGEHEAMAASSSDVFDDLVCQSLSANDIRRAVRRQLAHVSFGRMRLERDPLTGVHSALMLADHLQERIEQVARSGDSIMLTGVDVDRLRDINQRYGRAVGDSVIRSLAGSLQLAVDARDLIYRTDEDEFFVLQSADPAEWDEPRERLDRALSVFQQQTFRAPDGRGTYATASAGTVVVPPVQVSAETCLQKCWVVLERAVNSRKNSLLVARLDPSILPSTKVTRDTTSS